MGGKGGEIGYLGGGTRRQIGGDGVDVAAVVEISYSLTQCNNKDNKQ